MGEGTLRRWRRRFEEDGEAGLADRRLGKVSGREVPAEVAGEEMSDILCKGLL